MVAVPVHNEDGLPCARVWRLQHNLGQPEATAMENERGRTKSISENRQSAEEPSQSAEKPFRDACAAL